MYFVKKYYIKPAAFFGFLFGDETGVSGDFLLLPCALVLILKNIKISNLYFHSIIHVVIIKEHKL